jgi:hypothetical protein
MSCNVMFAERVRNIFRFKYDHKKESQADRSSERVGQKIPPPSRRKLFDFQSIRPLS